MRCQSCLTVNPSGNRFCENCGLQLQLTCAKCGHDVNLFARFCGNCGGAVAAAGAPVAADDTPKWGELKQATVLFADIVGSTELVAHMDPEQAMARMRPAILRMRHCVERFGGTVVRTLGDGVMAMFGVPRSLEGHALLACQSALRMQAAFQQGGDGLAIRIGLHSGQVASDPEDAEDGRGGGAHGLTIHLASRVMALAPPGGICLTNACRNEAGPGCLAESLGLHPLRGIPEPVEILALTGVQAAARRSSAGHLAQPTFRGRAHELSLLKEMIDAIGGRDAVNVLGIAGEPGAGKSRLCQEFGEACAAQGIPVFEVRAQLYGHALPLQPILELFRTHFFSIAPSDDGPAARARIAATFAPLGIEAPDLELLNEFFRVAAPDAQPSELPPRARQARLVGLLRDLVRHDAQSRRVILIEDLHWIDEASEEFVSALADAVKDTRTLLLLNYRAAYRAPWGRLSHFRQMDLGELPAPDMDALVAELLGPVSPLPDICRLVCVRSGGNPFFAEELVRTIAESGLVAPDTGLPVGGLEAIERALPSTLQAVIGARLDRVGEPEKTLLQMCAIIGKEIPLAVLESVASPLASQIEAGLEGLCQAGLILPQPARGGRRFAFRHPLIQEVAYGAQLKVRRGQVHASVAQAMELYYAGQLDEYAGLIGYHYEQAEQPVPSARFNARAAEWVGATNAAQAIRHWRKAHALSVKCPPEAEIDEIRLRAAARICWLGWRHGVELKEVRPLLDEAIRSARARDVHQTQLLLMAEGRVLHATGESADFYVERVLRALKLVPDSPPGRIATLNAALSQAYGWAGWLREALAANDLALAHVGAVDASDAEFVGFSIELWVLLMRARLLARLGRMQEALTCAEELVELCAATKDPVIMHMPHYTMAELGYHMGRPELVVRHHGVLAGLAREHETPYIQVFALRAEAMMHSMSDRAGEAIAALTQALSLVRSNVAVEVESELLADLAESHGAAGQPQAALKYAQEAAELSRRRGNRLPLTRALATWRDVVGSDPALADAHGEAARLQAEIGDLLERTGAMPARRSAPDLASPR